MIRKNIDSYNSYNIFAFNETNLFREKHPNEISEAD